MILAGTPLSMFSFFAGQQPNSNIGLVGQCDMPKRMGKCWHSWAESNSVEPYVATDEIRFAGRDLQLLGYVEGANSLVTEGNVKSLKDFVDTFTELVDFASIWGTYKVQIRGIEVNYINAFIFEVKINMFEPVVEMPTVLPVADAAIYGIDSISFEQLGGGLLKVAGDFRNRPALKQQYFTAYKTDGYQMVKTEAPQLSIELFIDASNYADFKTKINKLQALLASPGTRLMSVPNNTLREFFVTDGFKVTNIISNANYFFGVVTIKAIELFGLEENMVYLSDGSGDYITDLDLNKIKGYGGH